MNTKNMGILAVAIIVVVGLGAFFFSNKGKDQISVVPTPVITNNKETSSAQVQYKDGIYNEEGDYTSPAGAEAIDVSLTLKGDIVTDATVISKAVNPKSKYMQGLFVSNFKPLVVGKNVKDLKLDKVAGSSLTPQGFNDALVKIKAQAKT